MGTAEVSSEPGASPEPAGHRKPRRLLYLVVVAAVAIGVALAVILSGLLSSGSVVSVSVASEQSAAEIAAKFTSHEQGGPWQLTWVRGVLGGGPMNVSLYLSIATPCPVQNETVTSISAPAYSGEYYRGAAEAWYFNYVSTSGDSGLDVLVENGQALEAGQWSGPGCNPSDTPLGTNLVDSQTAADVLAATGPGSAFIAGHPQRNAFYLLEYLPYFSGFPPEPSGNATIWMVDWWGAGASPSAFGGEVFANNGSVVCFNVGGLDATCG